jgi:hypothetical protein
MADIWFGCAPARLQGNVAMALDRPFFGGRSKRDDHDDRSKQNSIPLSDRMILERGIPIERISRATANDRGGSTEDRSQIPVSAVRLLMGAIGHHPYRPSRAFL